MNRIIGLVVAFVFGVVLGGLALWPAPSEKTATAIDWDSSVARVVPTAHAPPTVPSDLMAFEAGPVRREGARSTRTPAKVKPGRISVRVRRGGKDAAATVKVDGLVAGPAPIDVGLPVGLHRVEITTDKGQYSVRRVRVESEQTHPVVFEVK